MLNVTKANVCAIMLVARSFLASTRGISTQERDSWGRKARDSMRRGEAFGSAEVRYRRML